MASATTAAVIPWLRTTASRPTEDAELLRRFVARRDEEAFEQLVRRHGPMVFAVCRRILRHTQDAEDAFQATFLVLAHKATTVSPPNKLAGWLHGVAFKTALKARQRAARRVQIEKQVSARGSATMDPEQQWASVRPILDEELLALPERYRLPIILCDFEGRLRSEAARLLACSEGTLSSQLTRGRRMLADRLKGRGVHLYGPALALIMAVPQSALSESLVRSTVPGVLTAVSACSQSGIGVGCGLSSHVVQLAKGVMKNMLMKKLQTVAVAAFVALAATIGVAGFANLQSAAAPLPGGQDPVEADKAITEALADVPCQVLMHRKVLKDLKCDMDQFDRILDKLEPAEKKAQTLVNEELHKALINLKMNGGNPEDFEKVQQEARKAGETHLRTAVKQVVTETLTAAQRKRLREIDLQVRSYEAFLLPSVAKALDLTAKQKEQFEANAKQVEEDIAQGFGKGVVVDPNGGVQKFEPMDHEKVLRNARAEAMKRAMNVLTDDQKNVWKNMIGEPFAHPINLNNSPWRGGFNRGGNRGGGGFVPAPPPVVVPAVPGNIPPANDLPAVPPQRVDPAAGKVLPPNRNE